MVDRFSKFAANNSKLILIIAVLLIIPSVFGIISSKINYDILSYLPDDLESVRGEKILDEVFGNAGSAFMIVENMPSDDVFVLKEKIAAVDGVKNVLWIDAFSDVTVPYEMLPDAISGIFYSEDGKSTLMMIRFEDLGASQSTMDAIDEIKRLMGKECFLSGMSVLMSDTKNIVESEAPLYIAMAGILAFAALVYTLNSFALPLIITTSLVFSVVYNMGTNFFGEVSYITQSIASILQIGVTMDYSVFLSDRFNEELIFTADKNKAMANAISKTFFSVSGSALTTVFGFLAMCFMSFSLGTDIGIVMSKGVVFGILTALLVLPSLILVFYRPSKAPERKLFLPDLGKLSSFSLGHKKIFTAIFILLIISSYLIKNNIDVYYDFVKALPQEMTSVASLSKLKTDFGMSSTYFALLNDDVDSYNALKLADEFRDVEGVSSVLSLQSVVGPSVPDEMIPDAVADICRKGGYELMMINSVYPSSGDETDVQAEKILNILKSYDGKGLLTGEAALSKDLVSVTAKDFRVTSIISVAAVFVIIALLFKSLIIPSILILSIELAVFINEAIPFFSGADVPFIAPTVIGCVQLGATVDYAILMTTRFKEELRKGKSKSDAIKDALSGSCKPVFQSALVLFCATFGVYCVCNVMLVKSICAMLARGAVLSAVVIVVFLPILLSFAEPFINRKIKVKDIE